MTPGDLLRSVIKPLPPARCAALVDAGIGRRLVRRAALGQPVNVTAHLKLCAAVGIDPFIEGRTFAPFVLGTFKRARLGEVMRRYRREDRKMHAREVAAETGLSVRALSFIENGEAVSIESTLAACRFVCIHPFVFAQRLTPDVSRETSLEAA